MKRDLRRLPREDRGGALAGLALELAERLDESNASLRDLSAISAQFHAVLLTLGKRQEPAAVLDPTDELARRRQERRARRLGSDAAAGD